MKRITLITLCVCFAAMCSSVGSPVLVPFSRCSSEPSLAHWGLEASAPIAPLLGASSGPTFPSHNTPGPTSDSTHIRRSESVGRRTLLRHPNPLPPLLHTRDSEYELEPLNRGHKRAIDNQYMFFWTRETDSFRDRDIQQGAPEKSGCCGASRWKWWRGTWAASQTSECTSSGLPVD